MARPLYIAGLGGLGDCIHQRAIVREYLAKGREVWLETPWPSVYHDLPVKLVAKPTTLRTQVKNMQRERRLFERAHRIPPSVERLAINYPPAMVREHGSVLGAMSAVAKVPVGDFRLPIPAAWRAKAQVWLDKWRPDKPLMIYRPLIERTEWSGCAARNPDEEAYHSLLESVSDGFFVISIADLVEGREWLAGEDANIFDSCADVEMHRGELDFETIAALTEMAGLVLTSPGFMAVLGQAVGTPTCVAFGGYENSSSFSAGARFAPYLPINPIVPCDSFLHDDNHPKAIDMKKAVDRLSGFLCANAGRMTVPEPIVFGGRSKVRPNVEVVPDRDIDLKGLPTNYMNPGELETLITLVRSVNPRVMIEIGCNNGRTAKAILRNVPSLERYVGIDVPPSYEFSKAVQRREVPPRPGELALDDPRFMLVLARRGTFDLTMDDLPGAGVVFIDGDHGAAAVRNDHDLAMNLIEKMTGASQGLIIHHDDHDEPTVDVRYTLDEISTPDAPISHVLGTWLAFQRVGG